MLIGQEGEKHGLVDFREAIEKSQQSELDLVQVSPFDRTQLFASLWITVNMFLQRKKHFIIKSQS